MHWLQAGAGQTGIHHTCTVPGFTIGLLVGILVLAGIQDADGELPSVTTGDGVECIMPTLSGALLLTTAGVQVGALEVVGMIPSGDLTDTIPGIHLGMDTTAGTAIRMRMDAEPATVGTM